VSNNETRKYWLGLKMCPAIRNRIYVLTERAGGPKRLWGANKDLLKEIGLSDELAAEAIAFRASIDLDAAYRKLTDKYISIVTDEDDNYPELLKHAPNRPKALFVKGALEKYKTAVAIVGSRKSTAYGKAFASELAADMVSAGVVIISGAARGIDTAAHRGAIEAGGTTYAVLGCGLDTVYPPENKNLFSQIISSGALISEYPPETPPLAHNFPARNRIVAGMCQGVVVVEAGAKSGALITADFALDYGRDVFAVPGHNRSEMSRGTNKLIKQGAFLVETSEDILSVLGIEHKLCPQTNTLTDIEKDLLEVLGWEPKRLDEIAKETNGGLASAPAILLSLELTGYIKKDITGNYIRLR